MHEVVIESFNEIEAFSVPRKKRNAIDIHVGVRIRKRRLEMGLNQTQLAGMLGFTSQQLSKYEIGENCVNAQKLFELAQMFDVSVSWFFEGLKPSDVALCAAQECTGATETRDPVGPRQRRELNRLFEEVPRAERPKILERMRQENNSKKAGTFSGSLTMGNK